MKISRGTTRITILTGNLAFKIPILNRSLKHFAKGWLGNIDERNLWRETKHKKLCPIYFSFFGLVNIMKRATPIKEVPFSKQFMLKYFQELDIHIDVCSGWKNFGYINGLSMVITDYAANRESGEFCSDCDKDCILKNA